MLSKTFLRTMFVFLFSILLFTQTSGQCLETDLGADVVSSYLWRGLKINSSPNIQPSLTFSVSGLSFGFWGSYSLSDKNSTDEDYIFSSEIDTWVSYTQEIDNGMSLTAIVTDYYFPNAGIKFGNFNNYDDPEGPGAHTIELGLLVAGPESLPITLSGFVNVHNDAGSNTYFQVDYSTSIGDVGVNFFAGATTGSKDNPAYYGADSFNVINLGIKTSKEIKVTDDFSIPVNASIIFNPKADAAFMVFGISL